MCGKFTAMAGWESVTSLSEIAACETGHAVTFRVMSTIPLIVWDPVSAKRRVIAARWGYPHPDDWRRPQPIHARAETIERLPAFAPQFLSGMRGIALVKSFNEAPDSGEQHVVTPKESVSSIAFLFRRFVAPLCLPQRKPSEDIFHRRPPAGAGEESRSQAAPSFIAAVMVTVPANALLMGLPTHRMPAILTPEDWAKWLGEEPATVEELKACLKTREGVGWTMTREHTGAKRRKATVAEPTGWF